MVGGQVDYDVVAKVLRCVGGPPTAVHAVLVRPHLRHALHDQPVTRREARSGEAGLFCLSSSPPCVTGCPLAPGPPPGLCRADTSCALVVPGDPMALACCRATLSAMRSRPGQEKTTVREARRKCAHLSREERNSSRLTEPSWLLSNSLISSATCGGAKVGLQGCKALCCQKSHGGRQHTHASHGILSRCQRDGRNAPWVQQGPSDKCWTARPPVVM